MRFSRHNVGHATPSGRGRLLLEADPPRPRARNHYRPRRVAGHPLPARPGPRVRWILHLIVLALCGLPFAAPFGPLLQLSPASDLAALSAAPTPIVPVQLADASAGGPSGCEDGADPTVCRPAMIDPTRAPRLTYRLLQPPPPGATAVPTLAGAGQPEAPKPITLQTYTVQQGDTLRQIALKFHLSNETVIWAN